MPKRNCDCGETDEDLRYCMHPGCVRVGCDSCDEVQWCAPEHDIGNGDYFCSYHRDIMDDDEYDPHAV